MTDKKDHWVDVKKVPTADKAGDQLDAVDDAADKEGYVSRAPRKTGKRGRPRNPLSEQIHSKVRPETKDWLLEEARRRCVMQGVILEEALELYKKQSRIERYLPSNY